MNVLVRLLIAFAGLCGAAGVGLAAAAAHLPDATRLGSASSMLLFHAAAIIGAVLLVDRSLAHRWVGTLAACGFAIGVALFAGDLCLRQFVGHSLFPMAAPSGGTTLIGSWLLLAVAALVAPRRPKC